MDNQHRKIAGYRELSQAEIDQMNSIKALGAQVGEAIQALKAMPGLDQRAVAIGMTEIQTGFMWLIRGITQPASFA
ncbi:hypothetical protein C0Q88_07885 [Ralstonia pickettii]|uniref:Acb2/Tad1 hairpin domain-containing protein n=1 Tax=Ralstonia pickettii TaxID=329 RepID=A0A2N4TY20_RALPI|nr:hypothetical protein [Ralstonia pickettii]PLC44591.1 hypothetical protein C0Q88_07885 [Ralstonia pickettii]